VRRILGVDARLDGVPVDRRRRELEPLAGRDAQLPLDEVDAEHSLGHRVLDLQAGVHLEEVMLRRACASAMNSTVPAPT